LRVLDVSEVDGQKVWHLAAYSDFFPDVSTAEAAVESPERLTLTYPHIAMTDRAFEGTQVARITSAPLTDEETNSVDNWRNDEDREIHDRSIRLLLGLR